MAGGQESEGLGIIHRYFAQVDIQPAGGADNLFGARQDGEVGQSQEVHLEQPDVGDVLHGELRHHQVARFAFAQLLQRGVIGQNLFGDDHAGGVRAGVA